MIIRVPVHTAVWPERGAGAFTVDVGVQVFVMGSYAAPLLESPAHADPPQTIILLSVQITLASLRGVGAPSCEIGDQMSSAGSYRYPNAYTRLPASVRQISNKLPVHTIWPWHGSGTSSRIPFCHVSSPGPAFGSVVLREVNAAAKSS